MSFQLLLLFSCVLSYNGVGGSKTVTTKYGDIYDCVDFYKQPSFDHPMLKNHNFHPLMRPSYLARSPEGNTSPKKIKLKKEGCPIGTVPIRRITKGASKTKSFISINEPSGTYDAGVRTKPGSTKYNGGGMSAVIYNPRTKPTTYSLARIKVSSGPEAIQAGWRVDPSLRGDNLTRFFIYTESSSSRCFDAQCGFVMVSKEFYLDGVITPTSQPGVLPHWEYKIYITRDPPSGNWWLVVSGDFDDKVGFWPKNIFTKLGDSLTYIEWAGEVYSPPGVFEPLMGSGYRPSLDSFDYVAYFRMIKVLTENNTYIDANDLEEFATDRSLYDVKDKGNRGDDIGHLVLYGGARY